MTRWLKPAAAAIVVIVGAISLQPALSADKFETVKHRQATMKRMGKGMEAIKHYVEGKADLKAAAAGAATVEEIAPTIPSLFPPATGAEQFPGKSGAKPVVWTDWNKFIAAQKNLVTKAGELNAAVKTGDKAKIKAAFADTGKHGCGGCHTTFREKIKS